MSGGDYFVDGYWVDAYWVDGYWVEAEEIEVTIIKCATSTANLFGVQSTLTLSETKTEGFSFNSVSDKQMFDSVSNGKVHKSISTIEKC